MRKLSDLQKAFYKRIEWMTVGFNEDRVVFGRYFDQLLKNKTHQKRAATYTEFELHPEMKLTMSLKEILSASRTNISLTSMFAQGFAGTLLQQQLLQAGRRTTPRSRVVILKKIVHTKRLIH